MVITFEQIMFFCNKRYAMTVKNYHAIKKS